MLPHLDALSEAASVQNAWGNDCALAASQTHTSVVPETHISSTNDCSTPPDTLQTETLDPNDDEFGEFETASTDPFKRPIYDATEDENDTLELLNPKSVPEWQANTFVGMGIVEPVRAGISMSTRTVLRVRKLAPWKLNSSREKTTIEVEQKRKRLQTNRAPTATFPASSPEKEHVARAAVSLIEADSNEYMEVPKTKTSVSDMNRVMRPVRFTGLAIDELIETERTAWAP
jgi:hypothetical protein